MKKENANCNSLKIENLSDLLKISPDKLKNAQYSDFSGKYFEQINNEVIKLEKKTKIQNNSPYEQIDNLISNNDIEDDSEDNDISDNYYDEKEESKINDISGIEYMKDDLNNNNESFNNIDISISQRNKFGIMQNFNNPIEAYSNNYEIKKIIFTIYYNTIFGQEIAISGSNDILGNWDKNRLLFLNWSKGNKWIGEINVNGDDLEDFEFKFVLCQNKGIIAWEPGENNNVYFSVLFNQIKENPKGRYNKYQYEYNRNSGELILNCKWFN
jgi:hypothetical protein